MRCSDRWDNRFSVAKFTCKNTLLWNAASVAISRSYLCEVESPYNSIDENKHHRALNETQDEIIIKKWNLNWQCFTSKIGYFPSSTVQNLKPQSKFHEYGLCLHIIKIRIAYWRSTLCNGCRRDRFGVTMTFHVLLKMAVRGIYCTSYVHTATKLRHSVVKN